MSQLLASKDLGSRSPVVVELHVVEGRYIVCGPNYMSGWLPSELSMLDALEWFDSTDIAFLNSVGEA